MKDNFQRWREIWSLHSSTRICVLCPKTPTETELQTSNSVRRPKPKRFNWKKTRVPRTRHSPRRRVPHWWWLWCVHLWRRIRRRDKRHRTHHCIPRNPHLDEGPANPRNFTKCSRLTTLSQSTIRRALFQHTYYPYTTGNLTKWSQTTSSLPWTNQPAV